MWKGVFIISTPSHLQFDASVPIWIRRIARRGVRRLQLYEWTINFYVVEADIIQDQPGADVLAITFLKPNRAGRAILPQYLRAEIWISNEAPKDEMESIVLHELFHLPFSSLSHIFEQAWDGRRKMKRADALRLLNDKIEELIERQLKIL